MQSWAPSPCCQYARRWRADTWKTDVACIYVQKCQPVSAKWAGANFQYFIEHMVSKAVEVCWGRPSSAAVKCVR